MRKLKKSLSSRILVIVWIFIVIIVSVATYLLANPLPFRSRSQEVQQSMLSSKMYSFIMFQQYGFEIQLTLNGEIIQGFNNVDEYLNPRSDKFDTRFNELVIVRTEEDTKGFPDNVVVAWLINRDWWQRYFYAVNWAIRLDEETVRRHVTSSPQWRPIGVAEFEQRFGLTYPINIDNVLNHFDQFFELQSRLNQDYYIRLFAAKLITELPPPAWQRSSQEQEPIPTTDETHLAPPVLTKSQQQLLDKFNYAYNFYFQFNDIDSVRAKIDPTNPAYDPSYTDIVFLQTAAEAESLPQGTIAAWLPEEQTTTQFIHMIHSALSFTEDELDILGEVLRDVVTLEQFSLSYPLHPSDLVDNWEKVNALWNALKPIEHYAIRAFALKE